MIPLGLATDLDLEPTHRVQGLTSRAADYHLTMLAAHLMSSPVIDRATFMRLADEAEAIAS